MWRVRFELSSMTPQGAIIDRLDISEGGFENKGQADAWLATGAKLRYGAAFWQRVRRICIEESHTVYLAKTPPFTAGGATRDGDTVVEATCWYTRTEEPEYDRYKRQDQGTEG
jgi:hypothetical protein